MQPAAGRHLTVRQMEYIVAVAEWGNLSRAAAFCLVSPASLAEQVTAAERTLGVTLFVRGKRRAAATPVGEQIIAACRSAVRAVDDVMHAARLGNAVRVGAIDTVAPYLFGPWMRQLRDTEHPRIIPVQAKTRDLIEQLRDGLLDAIIIAENAGTGLVNIQLGDDPLLLAVPGSEKPPTVAKFSDLENRDMLLLSDGHCLRDNAIEICRKAHVTGEHLGHLEASSIEVVIEMVANGLGSTLIPAVSASRFTGRRDVRIVPFEEELGVKRSLVLSYRKDHPQLKALQAVADIAAVTLGEISAAATRTKK